MGTRIIMSLNLDLDLTEEAILRCKNENEKHISNLIEEVKNIIDKEIEKENLTFAQVNAEKIVNTIIHCTPDFYPDDHRGHYLTFCERNKISKMSKNQLTTFIKLHLAYLKDGTDFYNCVNICSICDQCDMIRPNWAISYINSTVNEIKDRINSKIATTEDIIKLKLIKTAMPSYKIADENKPKILTMI